MKSIAIFYHHFKTSEIIGIGPLMHRGSRSKEQADIYNPRQLFFLLHCKGQTIEISSDWFELGHGECLTEAQRSERAAYKAYEAQYCQVVKNVVQLLEREEEAAQPTRKRKTAVATAQ